MGGVIGVLMGLGGAIGIARLANSAIGENLFRIQINYVLISSSVLFSFTLGILFGVFPAFQASKLNVVEALRK